jgi:hypothetical protein
MKLSMLKMKLNAGHLLILLIIALLGCAIFTCKMVEGLTGRGEATDVPVDSQTGQVLPYQPLVSSRNLPSGGMPAVPGSAFDPAMSLPTASEVNAQDDGVGFMGTIASPQSALPNGIPFSDIPDGDEDLYIKKSEIVPPVCPACPTISECPRQKPCPPCPACARCPEPAFECKKVPNYAADAAGAYSSFLPRPVLADFSTFGM